MDMKKWTLLVAMIGVLFATAFANDNDEIEKRREEVWKERRTFFKENVKPKVDAKRNELDASISAEDKQQIDKLRAEIISEMLIQNEFFFEARASRIKGEEADEALMMELRAQRIVIENLHDEAKLIANKYRPEIDDLISDLRGELKADQKNMPARRGPEKEMHDKGKGDHSKGAGMRNEGRGFHGGGPDGFERGGPRRNGFTDVVGFLLWDVDRG